MIEMNNVGRWNLMDNIKGTSLSSDKVNLFDLFFWWKIETE